MTLEKGDILFLDDSDERIKHFLYLMNYHSMKTNSELVLTTVKTAVECIEELENIEWKLVSLDHDLGGKVYVDSSREDTGMEVVRWITKWKPNIDRIIIHSWNIPAAELMESKLRDAGYKVNRTPFSV